MSAVPLDPPRRLIDLEVDGATVRVPEGATILDACRAEGIDTPTLCYADNLTPVNACRVCVVEVEGSRTLVPAAAARPSGHEGQTDTERVRHSRKLVMELLASSVEMDLASPDVHRWMGGTRPTRTGSARVWSRSRRGSATRRAGHHHAGDPTVAEGVYQPVKFDNELYVRDYARCVLCYKCVEACGVDAQNTFAIAVAGRGFDARFSTEYAVPLTSRLRLLRQLHRRVSDGRADVHVRARDARGGDLGRVGAVGRRHDLPLLRRGLRSSSTCRTTRS